MGKIAVLLITLLLFATSCRSIVSYSKTGNLVDKSLAATGVEAESGNIYFTEETGMLGELWGSLINAKKKKTSFATENDLAIKGKRTHSSDNLWLVGSADNVIDTVVFGATARRYQWDGSLSYDTIHVPIRFEMYVIGEGRGNKQYELISALCASPEPVTKKEKVMASLLDAVPKGGATMTIGKRIGAERAEVPFEIAQFTTKNGSIYTISVTQDFEYQMKLGQGTTEEEARRYYPKVSIRDFVFADGQIFQITNDNGTVYAYCSKETYTIYDTVLESEYENIKQCIGTFVGYLWSLDEHEKNTISLE